MKFWHLIEPAAWLLYGFSVYWLGFGIITFFPIDYQKLRMNSQVD
jgi:hypothetical protein